MEKNRYRRLTAIDEFGGKLVRPVEFSSYDTTKFEVLSEVNSEISSINGGDLRRWHEKEYKDYIKTRNTESYVKPNIVTQKITIQKGYVQCEYKGGNKEANAKRKLEENLKLKEVQNSCNSRFEIILSSDARSNGYLEINHKNVSFIKDMTSPISIYLGSPNVKPQKGFIVKTNNTDLPIKITSGVEQRKWIGNKFKIGDRIKVDVFSTNSFLLHEKE